MPRRGRFGLAEHAPVSPADVRPSGEGVVVIKQQVLDLAPVLEAAAALRPRHDLRRVAAVGALALLGGLGRRLGDRRHRRAAPPLPRRLAGREHIWRHSAADACWSSGAAGSGLVCGFGSDDAATWRDIHSSAAGSGLTCGGPSSARVGGGTHHRGQVRRPDHLLLAHARAHEIPRPRLRVDLTVALLLSPPAVYLADEHLTRSSGSGTRGDRRSGGLVADAAAAVLAAPAAMPAVPAAVIRDTQLRRSQLFLRPLHPGSVFQLQRLGGRPV